MAENSSVAAAPPEPTPASGAPSTVEYQDVISSSSQDSFNQTGHEGLSDEELESRLKGANSDVVAPKEPEPGKQEPATQTAPTPAPTPAKVDAATTPATQNDVAKPTTYAGKYKNTDELVKGVQNIAKVLGVDPKVAEWQVELSKESGDWKPLENMYLKMQKEYHAGASKREFSDPTPKPSEAPAAQAQSTEAQEVAEIQKNALDEVMRSPLMAEFRRNSVPIPTTPEEFDALKAEYPYWAKEFQDSFRASVQRWAGARQMFRESLAGRDAHNQQIVELETERIRDYAKENGFEVSDDELEQVMHSAAQDKSSYTDRNGVPYLSPNAITRTFYATVLPNKLKELRVNYAAQGRQQGVEDIANLQKGAVPTMSAAGMSTSEVKGKPVDSSNPRDVRALSDDDLDEKYRAALRK
jgi:hypothetical protein